MSRILTVSALSLATLLVSLNASSAQPGQQGPLWNRQAPSSNYSQPSFAPQAAVQAPTESQSFYNGPTDNRAVLLRVRVPADARVWIDGTATTQTGEFRSYISPPLTAGQNFTYEVKVQTGAGEQTRNVPVRSGDRITLDLRPGANQ